MPYNLDIPGWMPEPELKILERLARTIPAGGAMVEVGPFCGRSSWCWSKSVPQNVAVTCIDIWDPVEHPYSPPAKSDPSTTSGEDFGKSAQDHGTWEHGRISIITQEIVKISRPSGGEAQMISSNGRRIIWIWCFWTASTTIRSSTPM